MIPERHKDFYGDQTRWFVGTVVDINDPLELGRIKVRIYGIHGDDIVHNDLPWAQVIMPITQGGTKGFGNNLGIQYGAEAFGVFLDGQSSQMPLVLGSMPKYEDTENNTVQTNLLARTDLAVKHPSYINRARGRVDDDTGKVLEYYKAKPPKVTSVAPDKTSPADYYETKHWIEPPISGGEVPDYPNNHVTETFGGHVLELDNTAGRERSHRYHPSGSYEEIIATGQRTLKITGPNYELYLDSANIFINGDYNVTVGGNKRELIQGDYHLEVVGDMTMNLHQSLQTKVAFNQETEVGKFRVTNVGEDDNLSILNGDQNINIFTGNRVDYVKGFNNRTVRGNIFDICYGTYKIFADSDYGITIGGKLTMTANGIVTIETTKTMDITSDLAMTLTVENTGDLTLYGGPNIELNPA